EGDRFALKRGSCSSNPNLPTDGGSAMHMHGPFAHGKMKQSRRCSRRSSLLLGLMVLWSGMPPLALAQVNGGRTSETADISQTSNPSASALSGDQSATVKSSTDIVSMNGEVEALKRELAEQKKQIEELRQLLLSQKTAIDSTKQPSTAHGTVTPVHIASDQ